MRAVFCDVDGVLNSERFIRTLEEQHRQLGHHEVCECFKLMRQIDREAVTRLNRLVAETGAKIVISSSWRTLFDPPELHRILSEHGLVAEIIGETPDGSNDPEMRETYGYTDRIYRGHEIDLWLTKHPEVERFVILDDGGDMAMHQNRLVQTDCEEGLLDEHVDLAIRVLLWDGTSTPSPMDELEGKAPEEMVTARSNVNESSWGMHCQEEGCVETLTLTWTTARQITDAEAYERLSPAHGEAAVSLGWRVWHHVWWCPTHVIAKLLACARCLSPCPACSCVGGPFSQAVDGKIIDVPETP